MKERKTLAQTIAGRLRKSVTKVNPKAKKGFKASLKGRGFSKKEVKGALKKAGALAKATAKAAKPPAEAPEKAKVPAALQQVAKLGGQLRVTPRKGKF